MLNQFRKTLRTNSGVSKEHRDFVLIKDLYHCSPSELDRQDENILNLHYDMMMAERQHEAIEAKRQEQRSSATNKK